MKNDWKDIEPLMKNNWQAAICSIVNVPKSTFSPKHQPCPHCGGVDRFRFDNEFDYLGDGGAICNQCGNGSGITWLMKLSGMNFPEALEALAGFLNMTPPEKREALRKGMPKLNKSALSIDERQVKVIMEKHGGDTITGRNDDEMVAIELVMADTMTPCNVAFLAHDESVRFMAGHGVQYPNGRLTWGAVTPFGNKTEYTYLVANYIDAWNAHKLTGAHVWCCWAPENMWEVVRTVSDEMRSKLRCIINNNFDELCAAENAMLPVLLPDDCDDIRYAKKIRKVIYDAGKLLDDMKNPA